MTNGHFQQATGIAAPSDKSELHQIRSDTEAQALVIQSNHDFGDAGRRFWSDNSQGHIEALRLLKQFEDTAASLSNWGWSAERVKAELSPSREVFATSSFMGRCQRWPRGYAGDFETIEYLAARVNCSTAGSIGWHFEEVLLQSSIAQQHCNKLAHQGKEIANAVLRRRDARVLSIACGGCLDWVPVLPSLQGFTGEIVLNDYELDALSLAERRLRPATNQVRLAPGNILRVAKRLAQGPRFDLVIAGGLFDYLSDRAIVFLLRSAHQDLLAPGGVLLFTNIAKGNPWRALMEYGSNWNLIERTEGKIHKLCSDAGLPRSAVAVKRESSGLTILARVVANTGP